MRTSASKGVCLADLKDRAEQEYINDIRRTTDELRQFLEKHITYALKHGLTTVRFEVSDASMQHGDNPFDQVHWDQDTIHRIGLLLDGTNIHCEYVSPTATRGSWWTLWSTKYVPGSLTLTWRTS